MPGIVYLLVGEPTNVWPSVIFIKKHIAFRYKLAIWE